MTLVWLEGIVATIESYAKSKCYDPISWLHLHFAIWAIVVNPDDYHSKRTNAADTPVESPPHLSTSYIYNIYIYSIRYFFALAMLHSLSLSRRRRRRFVSEISLTVATTFSLSRYVEKYCCIYSIRVRLFCSPKTVLATNDETVCLEFLFFVWLQFTEFKMWIKFCKWYILIYSMRTTENIEQRLNKIISTTWMNFVCFFVSFAAHKWYFTTSCCWSFSNKNGRCEWIVSEMNDWLAERWAEWERRGGGEKVVLTVAGAWMRQTDARVASRVLFALAVSAKEASERDRESV